MNTKKYKGKHRPTFIRRVAGWMVLDVLSRNGSAVVTQVGARHSRGE
ncbi:hypothetical protein [Sciscionella sediminilitoris]|nr:hypothetical protein [Sciscionella sp. SE31]